MRRNAEVILACLTVALFVGFVVHYTYVVALNLDTTDTLLRIVSKNYGTVWERISQGLIGNSHYHSSAYALVLCLIISRLLPVSKGQRTISAGLLMDGLYHIAVFVLLVFFLPLYMQYLNFLCNLLFSDRRLDIHAPDIYRIVAGFLVADFLGWLHHLVRHKVSVFWAFHTVHHSQREMNPLTNFRVHPVDWVIARHITFIPVFFITQSIGLALIYFSLFYAMDRLNHSNIKTNLGILRYLIVTPQSHRIHHSIEARHRDHNFGVCLSIWDYLFGTQYRCYDEYPETGIADNTFPSERGEPFWRMPKLMLSQFAYPFALVSRGVRNR